MPSVSSSSASFPDTPSGYHLLRGPSAARLRKQNHILACAEEIFARDGFEGASLEAIGAASGFSRHNLLYYYPSKEALYQAVLESLLNDWLAHMTELSRDGDPKQQIREYIRAKFAFAQTRRFASQLFTKEMIAGAPYASQAVRERIAPMLATNVAAFEHWAEQGLIAKLNFTQLMFSIWALTQGYVDQHTQFALLLGKPQLDAADYAQAEALLVAMLSATLKIDLAD